MGKIREATSTRSVISHLVYSCKLGWLRPQIDAQCTMVAGKTIRSAANLAGADLLPISKATHMIYYASVDIQQYNYWLYKSSVARPAKRLRNVLPATTVHLFRFTRGLSTTGYFVLRSTITVLSRPDTLVLWPRCSSFPKERTGLVRMDINCRNQETLAETNNIA